ncbi:MAG TPA: glycosyltransferase family 4 protein [Gaiellaceae bacterium]|jgi:glycosyltransferase involved in cell wall biosynthesis|nr:glycosyltransferase family 4 protein [Gaiellaceae bacterium]
MTAGALAAPGHGRPAFDADAWPAGLGPQGLLRLFVVFHESESLGAGRSVVNCLGGLREKGWSATGWFPGPGRLVEEAADALALRIVCEKPIAYNVRGWRSAPGLPSRAARTPGYLRRLRLALLRARPHVVHVNTLRALPEAAVARSLGIPVVVHVHELPEARPKHAVVLRSAAAVADVLVAVSGAVAEVLRPVSGSTPVLTVHNGVDDEPVVRAPVPGLVGTVGTVCRAKGTDVFLRAAALARADCAELRFEHIGQSGLDHDHEFGDEVARLAAAPELSGAVELLGRRPAAEGLGRWEIFVLPSRRDAFPLATLEAMRAGLPVVATGIGGILEQIDHGDSGVLVAPDDPGALAGWIVRLHRDPALRERLGRAAAARAGERFGVAGQVEGLHLAYLAALNLRHAPASVQAATREALAS